MSSEKKPSARKRTTAPPKSDGTTPRPRAARARAAARTSVPSHQEIERRAYELWLRDGRTGDPLDHWLRAERELLTQRV